MANLPEVQLNYAPRCGLGSPSVHPASYDIDYFANDIDAWTPYVPQEYLSDGGLEPVQGDHWYHYLELPLYGTYQTDELCIPDAPLRGMNLDFVVHPQGPSLGLPTSNEHHEAVVYPIGVSPAIQTLAPTEPGPTLAPLAAAQPAVQPITHSRNYACGICPKTFDRPSRMKNCRNRHSGVKPHQCLGRCGTAGCALRYSSVDYLKRHINPTSLCECGESITKQNMSRHRAACGGH